MIKVAETPLMKQYNKFKAKHSLTILLFRVGDFTKLSGRCREGVSNFENRIDEESERSRLSC